MIVIKLGGSLLSSGNLLKCLDKIEQVYQGRAVVIVPGGGIFADQVRALQQDFKFNDRTAHHMAILAMQQLALLINGVKPKIKLVNSQPGLIEGKATKEILVWFPDIGEFDADKIPSSWDVTSDSLSAWLAKKLGAKELILVKSVTIDQNLEIKKLAELKIVDALFCEFTNQSPYSVNIVYVNDFLTQNYQYAHK